MENEEQGLESSYGELLNIKPDAECFIQMTLKMSILTNEAKDISKAFHKEYINAYEALARLDAICANVVKLRDEIKMHL